MRGVHGTPNTKAATSPNNGDRTTPIATPATSDPAPTRPLSAASTALTRPLPIPSSAYSPNSRARRRTRNTFA